MFAFLFVVAVLLRNNSIFAQEYDNPVFPEALPILPTVDPYYKKHIPRRLWIAVKDRNDELPGHLKTFFTLNKNWNLTVCDNSCKDKFMSKVFAGTSILWAYNTINPLVGAAKADIWRYSVLYTYGGVYLDDDSDIRKPLDEVIQNDDYLLMSEEGSSSLGACYNPNYHLSEVATFSTFTNYTSSPYYHGMSSENVPMMFHDHTLVNWAIFIAPRHPVLERTLRNVVEVIRSEYLRRSVIHMTRWDQRWKYVMCSTGFVLTYSTREIVLENSIPQEWMPKISQHNFRDHGGNVKAIWTGADPNHYMKAMNRKGGPQLLKEYAVVPIAEIIDHLEGKTVMGDAGREIYLIYHGKKRSFGDYETFLNLGFTDKTTKHLADVHLEQIPQGDIVKAEDGPAIKEWIKARSAMPAVFKHYKGGSSSSSSATTAPSLTTAVVPAVSTSTATATTTSVTVTQVSLSGEALEKTKTFLTEATRQLNNMTVLCFGDDYAGTRDDYLNNVHQKVLGDVPVMVYPFCARTFQLGNTLGYYLNDLACADLSGSHFVAVHKEFKLLDPDSLITQGADRLAFFDKLPDLVVNPSVKSPTEVKQLMRSECTCLQYCWEHSKAPWLKRVELVQNTVLASIDHYVSVSKAHEKGTVLNTTDLSTLPLNTVLPLIPNVTIQYRCGDNIGFGKKNYGLLPFSAYNTKRIDPTIAKYIYVIADSPSRSVGHVYNDRCTIILQHLFDRLKSNFPNAVVIVKRGGDAFLDYARIAYSNFVVCSASTFCFWPSLANKQGQVHFPLTPLIANAGDNTTAPFVKNNFHWIREVEMIKIFKNYRPWTDLIVDLEKL